MGRRDQILPLAIQGTAFLDELGRAPLDAQDKLLGFLDHGRITPIGAERELSLNVKLLAATNADLEAMVTQGTFQADLLDRFGYYVITLKPLRDDVTWIPSTSMEVTSAVRRSNLRMTPSLARKRPPGPATSARW